MNKKAGVLHWTLFGILAALAFFFLLIADLDLGDIAKGTWELGALEVFHEAKVDLAVIDSTAVFISELVSKRFKLLDENMGCGLHDNVALLNIKDKICDLKQKAADKFKLEFTQEAKESLTYDELIIDENYLVGKENDFKIKRQHKGDAGNLFSVTYSYNPSFRVKIPILNKYVTIQNSVYALFNKCKNNVDLKKCLDKNKRTDWKYGKCSAENYNDAERKVIFCMDKESFTIDFYSNEPFPVTELTVEPITGTDQYQVSFPYDQFADEFKIYFTNDLSIQMDYQGKAEDVIILNPDNYLKEVSFKQTSIVKDESKCSSRSSGKAYLCNQKIIYIIDHAQLEQGKDYLFTATTIKIDPDSFIGSIKESLVQKFVLNS
jgi:hypothetical protein